MKRIIAVVILIFIIILIYFTAHNSVTNYYNSEIKNLKSSIKYLESNDYENTLKSLKKVKDTKSILKYLYFEDVKGLDKSVKEGIFYAKHQNKDETLKAIFESIYILESFKEDFSLNLNKIF